MSNSQLTGSEAARFDVIHENWIVFEGLSNEEWSINNLLYSTKLGQQVRPSFTVSSGSVPSASGTITIEKIINVFETETDALRFIDEVGINNVVSYQERRFESDTENRRGSSFPS